MSASHEAELASAVITQEDMADRVAAVRSRIVRACGRARRDPAGVTLVAVSKGRPADAIAEAWAAGVCDFGENRVQEAPPKITALADRDIKPFWHLVGHLQTNKVRAALESFDILHSVDSERLAEAISARAVTRVRVLIEVNVAGEASKHGVAPAEVAALAGRMAALPKLDLAGLMTVAPQVPDAETVRHVFRGLRSLRDALGLQELSMGMSDDFEVAIEEGATMVRVGRALFEEPRAGGT